MRSVTVYGFGSAFSESTAASDVDLLIVHRGLDPESCQFAIACKQRLSEAVTRAHISMLSDGEEAHLQFIKTARAFCLGTIREEYFDGDLMTLGAVLPQLVTR